MGRKGPRAKTKTVLKPVNKMKQLVGMPMTNKEKNLNKNHPTTLGALYFTPVSRSLGQTVVAPNKPKQTNKNEKQISRNKQTKTRNE